MIQKWPWILDKEHIGAAQLRVRIASSSTLGSDIQAAQQTLEDDPVDGQRLTVRTQAAAPFSIEERIPVPNIGRKIAARIDRAGQQHIVGRVTSPRFDVVNVNFGVWDFGSFGI